jgi:predicted transcriptional regulator
MKPAPEQVKAAAVRLRQQGKSLKRIAALLGVSSSSVAKWTAHVRLTDEQRQRLIDDRTRQVTLANRERHSRRRQATREAGARRCRQCQRFRTICLLYWCEGKKGGNQFRVSNSDKQLLALVAGWLIQEGYGGLIRLSIYYHQENGRTEEEIKRWWATQLGGLNEHQFNKCRALPQNRNPKKWGKLPYGVCHLTVYRSTLLLQSVLGGIEYLKSETMFPECGGRTPVCEAGGHPGSTPGGNTSP